MVSGDGVQTRIAVYSQAHEGAGEHKFVIGGEGAPAAEAGLEGWTIQELSPQSGGGNVYTAPGLSCQMIGQGRALGRVVLESNTACSTLKPIAVQLNNVVKQYEFSQEDHGLFDFSTPDYVAAGTATADVANEVYGAAIQGGINAGGAHWL